jgi:hypothetical protein
LPTTILSLSLPTHTSFFLPLFCGVSLISVPQRWLLLIMIWLNNTFLSSLSKRKSVSSHLRCDASLLFIWCFPRRQWFPPSQICIPLFRFLNFSIYMFMCVRVCSLGIYRLFVSSIFPASKSVHFSLFPCAKVSVLIAIMYHRIEAATSFFFCCCSN